MISEFIRRVFKWILGLVGVESIEPPTDDLREKARTKIEQQISKIEFRRSISEVDAKSLEFDNFDINQSRYTIPIPKSVDSFIEFHSNEVIQNQPELIFAGTFLKQKKIAIKKIGADDKQLDREMTIADQLKHHENFLIHFFGFSQMGECYIATEPYEATLLSLFENPLKFKCEMDLRNILKQLCDGLEFLHESGVAHRYLLMRNIVVVMRGKSPIFKITNFRNAVMTSSEYDFKDDVKSLGKILYSLGRFKFGDIKGCWTSSGNSDSILLLDIADRMTSENFRDRPSISKIKAHPFLWTPHKTLHFIIELAKLLESRNAPTLCDALKRVSPEIFSNDWRSYIDRYVIDELKSINFGNNPPPGIFGLVKTIRNLTVHHRTSEIERAMGTTEAHLLLYWNDCFPELVLQLYKADDQHLEKVRNPRVSKKLN